MYYDVGAYSAGPVDRRDNIYDYPAGPGPPAYRNEIYAYPAPSHMRDDTYAYPAGLRPPSHTISNINVQKWVACRCLRCATNLSYQEGASLLECPRCHEMIIPGDLERGYTMCLGCDKLMFFPRNALTIQCPNCLMITEMNRHHYPTAIDHSRSTPVVKKQIKCKRKRERDPKARKVANGYMVFCKERRPAIAKSRKNLSFGQIGAAMGEQWRNLSEAERDEFQAKAVRQVIEDEENAKSELEAIRAKNSSAADTNSATVIPPVSSMRLQPL